ncbi:hypothetical protein AGMMS49944_31450 [Spirochaetia bacterium]|nr:hypothetical protein AGMMS49944_31450 [Spirochaetia bacterium]
MLDQDYHNKIYHQDPECVSKSLSHRPREKEYAVYINAVEKNEKDTLRVITVNLRQLGITISSSGTETWEQLCSKLRSHFESGQIKKLMLLIDEADTFLRQAEKNRFAVLQSLLDLKSKTKNSFKFVFAGLHNVARSRAAIEENGLFPQMAPPLCIRPLSPSDARNLLKRPLSYLGFKMDHLQQLELILANTNYYPGILHFFGHSLVETVSERYGDIRTLYDNRFLIIQ